MINRIVAFVKCLKRLGYINCSVTTYDWRFN